jgi:hypothetical protein
MAAAMDMASNGRFSERTIHTSWCCGSLLQPDIPDCSANNLEPDHVALGDDGPRLIGGAAWPQNQPPPDTGGKPPERTARRAASMHQPRLGGLLQLQ